MCIGTGSSPLFAKEINNFRWRYQVNIPDTWLAQSSSDSERVQKFHSPQSQMELQITAIPSREVQNLETLYQEDLQALGGSGLVSPFNAWGYPSLLAKINYSLNGKAYSSYTFYFIGSRFAYKVASIGPAQPSPEQTDLMYSVLDSFALEEIGYWTYGPLSAFQLSSKKGKSQSYKINLDQHEFSIFISSAQVELSEEFLQREYRILEQSSGDSYAYALARYYRLAFRHHYPMLRQLSQHFDNYYAKQSKLDPIYEILLYSLQSMASSSKAIALSSPLAVLEKGKGSLADLALIYSIMLSQLGYASLMLVSPDYQQIIVGCELKQDKLPLNIGVIINWYQHNFLLGELSAEVYIGWVKQELADLNRWTPIYLPAYRKPVVFP